jgi:hypothetical protein
MGFEWLAGRTQTWTRKGKSKDQIERVLKNGVGRSTLSKRELKVLTERAEREDRIAKASAELKARPVVVVRKRSGDAR